MLYFCCTIPTLVLIFKPCQQITQSNRFTEGQCFFLTQCQNFISSYFRRCKKSSNNKKLLCHWPTQNHLTIKNCYVISQGSNFKILCQLKQLDFLPVWIAYQQFCLIQTTCPKDHDDDITILFLIQLLTWAISSDGSQIICDII